MLIKNNILEKKPLLYKILKEYNEVIIIILATIVITYCYTYVARVIVKNNFPKTFIGFWKVYDANHYLNIIKLGYGTTDVRRVLIAFFPFYPLLIKLFSFIFIDYTLSALVVSNIAYACAALYLYKIVCLDYSKDTAIRAVIYFSIFPTAYFMHGVYTEALFIALIVSCFYYARKKQWLVSGILGMCASATRLSGIIVVIALLLEYLHQKNWKIKEIKADIVFIGLVPLGLCSYLLINYIVFDHPFHFLTLQNEVWHKTFSLPTKGLAGAFGSIKWKEPTQIIISAVSEIVVTLFVFVLILWMVVKYRPLYTSYSWLTWLVVTSNSYWLSLPRYMLPIFPMFIIMAKWGKNKGVNFLIILILLLFYGVFAGRFTQGMWSF